MSDDENDDEESSSNYYTVISDHICIVISELLNERWKHISILYAVNGCMSCVVPHIIEDVFNISNGKHHIQVNDGIKSFYYGSSEKELYETLDTFWSEYKNQS